MPTDFAMSCSSLIVFGSSSLIFKVKSAIGASSTT